MSVFSLSYSNMLAVLGVFVLMTGISCSYQNHDPGAEVKSGKVQLSQTPANDPGCSDVLFTTQFKQDLDIRVFVSISHSDLNRRLHDPAALWVKQITSRGFKVCVRESGVGSNNTGMVNWLATRGRLSGVEQGALSFDQWSAGTQCKTVRTQNVHSRPLHVFASVISPDSSGIQDAMNVWVVNNLKGTTFSVCLREMMNFDGIHSQLQVNWIAFEKMPDSMNYTEFNKVLISDSDQQVDSAFCKNVQFDQEFHSPPTVLVTASYHSNDSRPLTQQCNAMNAWVEEITKTYYRMCVRELPPRIKGNLIYINYIVLGDLDPCINVSCKYFAECKAFAPRDARCVCVADCPSYEEQVCSSNGTTFQNPCYYKLEMCRRKSNHSLYHPGSCSGFPLQKGRRSISSLVNEETSCKEVKFSPFAFYPDKRVHVHITVNHINTSNPNYVHDAIASWVEDVGYLGFKACLTIAGRGERSREAHATFDWFAFQGAPDGAVTDRTRMDEWWTGTKCKTIELPKDKFQSVPTVIVTAEHINVAFKHDAANIWLEKVNQTYFQVCLRELQNFDGLHENIHVSWMAFERIPRPFVSEKYSVLFTNPGRPSAKYNGAFCKDMPYSRKYRHVPIIILSTSHTAALTKTACTGVSTWIEYMNTTGCRVCVKELYTSKYELLTVSLLLLSDLCSKRWDYFDGICYKTSSTCAPWNKSENYCRSHKSNLVTIRSQRENVFVQQQLNGAKGWIGLNDKGVEGDYRWTSQLKSNFTFWAKNQPNSVGDEDCVHSLGVNRNYQWNDVPCDECHNFTCAKDLDECQTELHGCHESATCSNTYGSHSCRCLSGYSGDGQRCVDIDECSVMSPCHVNATCINIPGSFACHCDNGFTGDGFHCNDIDECATAGHDCDVNAVCNNTVGSYDCTCNREYHGNGTTCLYYNYRGLSSSAILRDYGNANYLGSLSSFLDPVLQSPSSSLWTKCWHASQDGWDVNAVFHAQCNGKGPTVTIVRVGSYVFGGYIDVSWHSRGQYVSSSRSFLYSLYNGNGYNPTKLTLTGSYNQYAIYGNSGYGPTFGGGHDLHISNYASSNQNSYTNCPFSYNCPSNSFLAGSYQFTPSDIEVFYETTS